jgi:hypothetical protein
VRALGQSRERAALDALLRLVDGGKSVFGRPKLAAPTPIVVAAVRALVEAWSTDPKAGDMLTLARGSSDPQLRLAAAGGQA